SIALGLIFQDISRTLTDDDVERLMAASVADLRESLNAKIREYRDGPDQGGDGGSAVQPARPQQAGSAGARGSLLRGSSRGPFERGASEALRLRQFRPARQKPASRTQSQNRGGDTHQRAARGDIPSRTKTEGAGRSLCWSQRITLSCRRSPASAISRSARSVSCAV